MGTREVKRRFAAIRNNEDRKGYSPLAGEDEMMRGKIPLRPASYSWCRSITFLMFLLFLTVPFSSQAEVVRGKVTSIRGNVMELDLGTEKGIRLGDSGKVCYNILIQGKERSISIAKFTITHVSNRSSVAQVEEKTGEVKVGYLVEIIFKGGELELSSDPSGAKIYVDGKERGETPFVVSDVKSGSHVIRIVKQGYEPYEEQVNVVERERKKVSASLKMAGGVLFVNTDPSGANIYINEMSVGVSPYKGRDLFFGTYRVRVTKEGYDTWQQDVVVKPGKDVQVFATLREVQSPTRTKEQVASSPEARPSPPPKEIEPSPSSKETSPREETGIARLPDKETGSRDGEAVLLSSLIDKGPALLRENNQTKLIQDINELSAAERQNTNMMILECFAHLKNWILKKDKKSKATWGNRYKVLLRSEDRTATPLLVQISKDPEVYTRLYAVILLGYIGDRRALDNLREIAANDSNSKIRKSATKAILQIENSLIEKKK